jgi:hypothetical protein
VPHHLFSLSGPKNEKKKEKLSCGVHYSKLDGNPCLIHETLKSIADLPICRLPDGVCSQLFIFGKKKQGVNQQCTRRFVLMTERS